MAIKKIKLDVFGNKIPKDKKERDAQFKKIVAMQRKDEDIRLRASLKNAKLNMRLNKSIV